MHFYKKLLLVATAICTDSIAIAKDDDEKKKPEVTIIQERMFDKKHEVGFLVGHLPDDNFYEVFPLSVNYTHHFNQRYAWEVIRASYMVNSERDIKQDLEQNFGVTPSTFDELTSHFETSFVVKPTYGKDSWWNKKILNNEGFLSVGAGLATFERKLSFGEAETENALTFSLGMGRKYFINKSLNLSFELKDIFMVKENTTENYVYLGVGLNYRFNVMGSMHKSRKEDTSIYEYLK